LNPDIETLFVMTAPEFSFISSRLIKETVLLGADISAFIPPSVQKHLLERVSQQSGSE
jgi:pantetheine-phosphate adenylyltransferase